MTKVKYIFVLLILCSAYYTYGQINCSRDKLIGLWSQFESMPGVQTNVDSLKSLFSKSSNIFATLDLKADGTYRYTFHETADKKDNLYNLNSLSCEIIFGSKKDRRKNSNLEILYLDNKFLIFGEDNNPKGYITHVMVKKDGSH